MHWRLHESTQNFELIDDHSETDVGPTEIMVDSNYMINSG